MLDYYLTLPCNLSCLTPSLVFWSVGSPPPPTPPPHPLTIFLKATLRVSVWQCWWCHHDDEMLGLWQEELGQNTNLLNIGQDLVIVNINAHYKHSSKYRVLRKRIDTMTAAGASQCHTILKNYHHTSWRCIFTTNLALLIPYPFYIGLVRGGGGGGGGKGSGSVVECRVQVHPNLGASVVMCVVESQRMMLGCLQSLP